MVEGHQFPEQVRGPITRSTLALFAGGSHDHVPLHIDSDFAKSAGMDDVFAHGMLSMAYLAQALRDWVPGGTLIEWNVRFTAITPLHATVYCRASVVEIVNVDAQPRARLKIGTWTDGDIQTLDGDAVIALN